MQTKGGISYLPVTREEISSLVEMILFYSRPRIFIT